MFQHVLFSLIIITGVLTSLTDFTCRQIKNHHLIIMGLLGTLVYLFEMVFQHGVSSFQFANFGVAVLIGIVCYIQKLWRGGDVKLFLLYVFLMPKIGRETFLSMPCVGFFMCSFMAGMIFLIPDVVRTFIINRQKIFTETFSRKGSKSILNSLLNGICLSWIIFPIFLSFGIAQYGSLSFLIGNIIGFVFREFLKYLQSLFALIPVLMLGVVLRVFFFPDFFTWPHWLVYLGMVFYFTLWGTLIFQVIEQMQGSKERVPFAPFLFLGCLLSYTPFLNWIMLALRR